MRIRFYRGLLQWQQHPKTTARSAQKSSGKSDGSNKNNTKRQ
jgi:hypothetical protein